ncbi:LysR family transcriptional regulator [Erwiniaceae bacterium L1_54_6]|jgi:DNA-binding transcriptional LysR family regulator|uniref:LysR family transcriptional regulator n=1 Tax=Pantoea cypripedii TaxID=55209 RepID=A0A6B9GAY0_PANCY|nr:LysR family transcriptional regulator [Pantoea cypripedii]MDF7662482.1 LysR family transcriptional regulator [Erwiniaceae bacterium L1_54_6]QGY33003.1 LysR family transcriptional regulator [Pantoea cypripedii]
MQNRAEMIRIFVAASDAQSFREAASRLGISPQKVTRAIQELEYLLGEPLFHRSTRQLHLTTFGAEVCQDATKALNEFERVFTKRSAGAVNEIAGRVVITAPLAIGRLYLTRFLDELMTTHPHLTLSLHLEDELTDAIASQIDVGIRVGRVRHQNFIAKVVSPVPLVTVCSPSLVRRYPDIVAVHDLERCPLSLLMDRKSGKPWPWIFREGEIFVPAAPVFISDDPETELEMALAGKVFTQMPRYLAETHLLSGSLVEVLAEAAPTPMELVIYRTQSGPVPPRTRIVYDHLIACFSDATLFPR